MLSKLKISTKIIGSTLIVLVMFIAFAYLSHNNLSKVADRAEKAADMQRMTIAILEARRHEKNLLLRNEAQYRDRALNATGEAKSIAQDAKQRFRQADNKRLMDEAIAAIEQYEAALGQLALAIQPGTASHSTLAELDKKMVDAARKAQDACEAARKDQQDEMKATVGEANYLNAIFLILFLVAAGMGSVIVIRGVMHSIQAIVNGTKGVAEGNLAIPPLEANETEMGRLGQAFNSMIANVGDTVKDVTASAANVSVSAHKIHVVADQISETTTEVAAQSRAVTEASTDIANSSASIANTCNVASQGAQNTKVAAEEGVVVVGQTVQMMKEIAATVEASSRTVASLGERSKQIGAIIGTIKEIADQTNLLALNAAIEAARAGEQGRGFAVVADEVRKLAERTTDSTHEIGSMIKSIQDETVSAVAEMERGTQQVATGTQEAARSGEALNAILAQVSALASQLDEISTLVERQSSATEEISSSMQSIASTIQLTAEEASRSAIAASELNHVAEELMGNIGKLTVHEDAPLAISKAKSAHMIFVGKIKAHLEGAAKVDANALPTHQTCAFGKWYHSEGMKLLAGNDQFRAIDAPHAQVHELGKQAVRAADAGDQTKARAICEQMEAASMALVDMLDKLNPPPRSR